MARRKRKTPKPPSVPPPRPRVPRKSRSGPETPEVVHEKETTSAEDLDDQYAHVRKDLIRIAVLAVIVFALILASYYVFPVA